MVASRLLWGKAGVGDVRIYLAQRAEPDRSSPGASSLYFEKTGAGER